MGFSIGVLEVSRFLQRPAVSMGKVRWFVKTSYHTGSLWPIDTEFYLPSRTIVFVKLYPGGGSQGSPESIL